jgi:Ribose/xylose/arabinose/galactoside ABC-type transport systems, permease components
MSAIASVRLRRGEVSLADWGVWIALIALILFNALATSRFLSLQTLQTNLTQMAAIAILAMGMTLVIATGGIDLSIGALMALAGAFAGTAMVADLPIIHTPVIGLLLVLLIAVVVSGLFGLVNGVLIGGLGLQPIIATLGVLIAGRGIAQLITSGRLFTVDDAQVLELARGQFLGLSNQAWIMFLAIAAAAVLRRASVFGRYVVAVGGNERAARSAGVPVRSMKIAVYTLMGCLAGVAAVLSIGINGTVDTANLGLNWEFTVISAVVVGGTPLTGGRPRIAGTVGGVALLQLLTFTLASHNIPKEVANLIQAAVIVAAVALQLRRKK